MEIFIDKNILLNSKIRYNLFKSFSSSAVYKSDNLPLLTVLKNKIQFSPFTISSEDNFSFPEYIIISDNSVYFNKIKIRKINLFNSYFNVNSININKKNLIKYIKLFALHSKTGIPYDKYSKITPIVEYSSIETLINKISGFGGGLTPLGDDFILGFITGTRLVNGPEYFINMDNLNIYSKNLIFLFNNNYFPDFIINILNDITNELSINKYPGYKYLGYKSSISNNISLAKKFGNSTGIAICDGLFTAFDNYCNQ